MIITITMITILWVMSMGRKKRGNIISDMSKDTRQWKTCYDEAVHNSIIEDI